MTDVNLHRDFFMTVPGGDITVTAEGMTVETGWGNVEITGADYDRLKAEIARYVNPAMIMGKPLRGIGGEDIFLGIRKRSEGL